MKISNNKSVHRYVNIAQLTYFDPGQDVQNGFMLKTAQQLTFMNSRLSFPALCSRLIYCYGLSNRTELIVLYIH